MVDHELVGRVEEAGFCFYKQIVLDNRNVYGSERAQAREPVNFLDDTAPILHRQADRVNQIEWIKAPGNQPNRAD